MFKPKLSSIIAGFSETVDKLDHFLEINSKELAELSEKQQHCQEEQARASRIQQKLEELIE